MPLLVPRRSMRYSTSEPAAPLARGLRGRLYRRRHSGRSASGYGHLTQSRPRDSDSNAAAPQWEPRKPLAGIHAAMRADEMLKRVVKAVQKALRE